MADPIAGCGRSRTAESRAGTGTSTGGKITGTLPTQAHPEVRVGAIHRASSSEISRSSRQSTFLVLVPVVQIGPVRMAVHERLVAMAVGVPERARLARMRVVVVAVVVAVRVLVLERGVGVRVRVPIEAEQRDARTE